MLQHRRIKCIHILNLQKLKTVAKVCIHTKIKKSKTNLGVLGFWGFGVLGFAIRV